MISAQTFLAFLTSTLFHVPLLGNPKSSITKCKLMLTFITTHLHGGCADALYSLTCLFYSAGRETTIDIWQSLQ